METKANAPLPHLGGITVVELGQNLAAPYAASIFGELGANVIKIEKDGGDDCRGWGPPFVDGTSTSFHLMNRNKKSIVLSLDQPQDKAVFDRLIAKADIFIHNLRPGVEEKLGVDAAALMRLNPRLIYCGMNAFGHAGPMESKPGYEPLLQAFAGLVSVNGDPAGPPSRVGPSIVDMGTGMWTVIGALTALLNRQATGQGSVVQTSLFETALGWVSRHVADYGATGKIPPRVGTGHNSLTPYQAFEAADGPVVIAAGNDRLFAKMAGVLGHSEWVNDPRFATNAERTRNRDTLLPMIVELVRLRPAQQWTDLLEAAGVPCAPINSVPQVVAHEQTHAIGMLLDSQNEQLKIMGLPLSIDGQRPGFGAKAPALGEHQQSLSE
ncbi:MAG: CoA transferase [Comamonadaceae bacterium]|jgi:crotonobetainyl-CoA:carnitine CoA-transferase CaiB-like acyl-CoA transferase|uniref:CaiB/BaiF CoA transferase family protein n=1 Tax=Candidatus Skiveiella danica TaxID=3386177 RepID=UPI001B6E4436|nr:CoA transferase [Comamonadaceae bacterium]MBK9200279.1 CoA transferase [Betaproteobacteria bacterium]MBP6502423.1 CoA transferase [Rhodoferax sp.]MBK6556934.1 CoA transferase [Comamonadaceae bacterium]MBK6926479.1 CoA transferase [Comamonadaceae bacterium]